MIHVGLQKQSGPPRNAKQWGGPFFAGGGGLRDPRLNSIAATALPEHRHDFGRHGFGARLGSTSQLIALKFYRALEQALQRPDRWLESQYLSHAWAAPLVVSSVLGGSVIDTGSHPKCWTNFPERGAA